MAKKKRKTLSILLACILVVLAGVKTKLYLNDSPEISKFKDNPMTKLTHDNPAAGLVIIGSALKEYQQAHGRYPQRLKELYPKYIPEAQVVNQAAWRYSSDGSTLFTLERTVARLGGTLVYKIDPGLKLAKVKVDGEHAKVASSEQKRKPEGPTHSTSLASALHDIQVARLEEKENQTLESSLNNAHEDSSKELKRTSVPWTTAESRGVHIPQQYKELAKTLQISSLLVWVSNKETLCFSNVQYSEPLHIRAINASSGWMVLKQHEG
jgi:hypothetical protein